MVDDQAARLAAVLAGKAVSDERGLALSVEAESIRVDSIPFRAMRVGHAVGLTLSEDALAVSRVARSS